MNDVQTPSGRRLSRKLQGFSIVLGACCLAILAVGPVNSTLRMPFAAVEEEKTGEEKPESASAGIDRRQLIGTWRDKFFGTRTLILNEDGTAQMILDLDFAGRMMYGKRLDFDMTWSVEGATVTIDIVEGRPAKQAKSAIETWGSRYEYLLDCVEDHQIEMRDSDGSMNYKLRRVSEENADAKK